jgi:hypothetical protein
MPRVDETCEPTKPKRINEMGCGQQEEGHLPGCLGPSAADQQSEAQMGQGGRQSGGKLRNGQNPWPPEIARAPSDFSTATPSHLPDIDRISALQPGRIRLAPAAHRHEKDTTSAEHRFQILSDHRLVFPRLAAHRCCLVPMSVGDHPIDRETTVHPVGFDHKSPPDHSDIGPTSSPHAPPLGAEFGTSAQVDTTAAMDVCDIGAGCTISRIGMISENRRSNSELEPRIESCSNPLFNRADAMTMNGK